MTFFMQGKCKVNVVQNLTIELSIEKQYQKHIISQRTVLHRHFLEHVRRGSLNTEEGVCLIFWRHQSGW